MAQLGDTIVKGDLHVLGDFVGQDGANYVDKFGLAQGTADIQLVSGISTTAPRYYKLMEFVMNKMGNQDLFLVLAYEHVREVQDTNKTCKFLSFSIRSNGTGTSCVPANPTYRLIAEDIGNYRDNLKVTYKNVSGVITISFYMYLYYSYSFTKLRLLDMTTRSNHMPSYKTYNYITSSSYLSAIPTNETEVLMTNNNPVVYSGTAEPASTLGNNGDIYLQLES